jgi:hypothetical protein
MMALKQISATFAAFLSIALLSVAPVRAQEMKGSMKPMEGMEPAKSMKPMGGMGSMTMPANAPTVPPVKAGCRHRLGEWRRVRLDRR